MKKLFFVILIFCFTYGYAVADDYIILNLGDGFKEYGNYTSLEWSNFTEFIGLGVSIYFYDRPGCELQFLVRYPFQYFEPYLGLGLLANLEFLPYALLIVLDEDTGDLEYYGDFGYSATAGARFFPIKNFMIGAFIKHVFVIHNKNERNFNDTVYGASIGVAF
jgi:hypothetical protein